ncbi:MAG: penicillin-binding protein 2 [Lachnospiraceae bacterium]|nr:penicillin-binding protein 2 [Lachnospiraceae bacterium]
MSAKKKQSGKQSGKQGEADRALQQKIGNKMILMALVMGAAFCFLIGKTYTIMRDNGDKYKKQVLSQQKYDSVTIPFQRGAIKDRNGTLLAYSERVYNVILDCYVMNHSNDDGAGITPTIAALNSCFGLDVQELRAYVAANPDTRYHILKKEVSYDEMLAYQEYIENYNTTINSENKNREEKLPRAYDKAVWFEDRFKRVYPGDSLACDVIGFTTGDGRGQYGLEEYYNDTLTGRDGREYGYLTAENALERTVVPAQNGNTIVTTIDSHIQKVCEDNLKAYDEAHAGEFREGEMGSDNTGVIVMDIHSGEILAMASYPYFNLNDPKDLSMYSDAQVAQLIEREGGEEEASQFLWKNFCISQSYEPGSVCKTFTVAAALDCGAISDGDSFDCKGYLTFGEGEHATTIRCHQRYGDGMVTVKQAVEKSCNVALMLIGQKLTKERFLKYQRSFNFGLRTNIDLAGEMRTSSLVFNENNMGITELMTSTFGQGFNVTMIQTISAYASLVNGGYYYQPHLVKQIQDSNGAVVENIEPRLMRQVVSESVSRLMVDYCIGVVDEGTGVRARPAGYRIGGKTGTAERSGQGKRDYTVSFMGFAPADDPQIAVYVVIDRPNTASQENGTRYACLLCRDILTDVLPYMHIFMTEPLTAAEKEELEEKGKKLTLDEESLSANSVSDNAMTQESTEKPEDVRILIDNKTGYAIDPINGERLDPATGAPIDDNSSIFQDATGQPIEIRVLNGEDEGKEDPRE